MPDGRATAHLFRPKLVTILTEGYNLDAFRKDVIAALTVAVVALPLSMAIAVASGVSPARGLYTAIVGGFLVSAFGGSRFQIGGPAGAFIVIVSATVLRFGLDGLLVAVPGHAFNADGGDVAAEAAETLDHCDVDARARGAEGSRKAGGAGADNQHVGLVDDVYRPSGLADGA